MPTTKQSIFNRVVKHLLKQKVKSKRGYYCAYRSEEGLKCAVGVLIPDRDYDPLMEGDVFTLIDCAVFYSYKIPKYFQKYSNFLHQLQGIHDYSDPEFWETRFQELAKEHNLTMPS